MEQLYLSTPAAAGPEALASPDGLFLPYKKERPFLMSPECFLALGRTRSSVHAFPPSAVHPGAHLHQKTPACCREDDAPTTTPFQMAAKIPGNV